MAAGDTKLSVPKISIQAGKAVTVEFRHRIVAKNAEAETGKGNTITVSWGDFKALTTETERNALASVRDKLRAYVKTRISYLSDAIEE